MQCKLTQNAMSISRPHCYMQKRKCSERPFNECRRNRQMTTLASHMFEEKVQWADEALKCPQFSFDCWISWTSAESSFQHAFCCPAGTHLRNHNNFINGETNCHKVRALRVTTIPFSTIMFPFTSYETNSICRSLHVKSLPMPNHHKLDLIHEAHVEANHSGFAAGRSPYCWLHRHKLVCDQYVMHCCLELYTGPTAFTQLTIRSLSPNNNQNMC